MSYETGWWVALALCLLAAGVFAAGVWWESRHG